MRYLNIAIVFFANLFASHKDAEQTERMSTWTDWFAWYPVCWGFNEWAWMRTIQVRYDIVDDVVYYREKPTYF